MMLFAFACTFSKFTSSASFVKVFTKATSCALYITPESAALLDEMAANLSLMMQRCTWWDIICLLVFPEWAFERDIRKDEIDF
jgi:hypothetical protein